MSRFLTGFAVCWTLDKLAWKLALSDTDTGRQVMSTVLGRLGHDRFWAVYDAVNAEKERRADSTL